MQGRAVPYGCSSAIEAGLGRVQPTLDLLEVGAARRDRLEFQAMTILEYQLAVAQSHGQISLVDLQVVAGAQQDQIRRCRLTTVGPLFDVMRMKMVPSSAARR